MKKTYTGKIEVICGPMFSGKSEELLKRLKRLEIAKKSVLTVKPCFDTRFYSNCVASRAGTKINCIPVSSSQDIYRICEEFKPQILGVDEIQFFDSDIVKVLRDISDFGIRVIACGLDMDYNGNQFNITSSLMAIAEKVTKLNAICSICGKKAYYSNLKNKSSQDILLLDNGNNYDARCRKHLFSGEE